MAATSEVAAARADARSGTLTADAAIALSRHGDTFVRAALAANPACPRSVLASLASDHSTRVRSAVAVNASTPPDALEILASDPSVDIRLNVARHPNASPKALTTAVAAGVRDVAREAARHPNAGPELLSTLAHHDEWRVRVQAAAHPATPIHVLNDVALDPVHDVRAGVARNPALTETLAMKLFSCSGSDESVLAALAANPHTPARLLGALFRVTDDATRATILANPSCPPTLIASQVGEFNPKTATVIEWAIYRAIASNPATPARVLRHLTTITDTSIVDAALDNPSMPSAEVDALIRQGGDISRPTTGTLAGRRALRAKRRAISALGVVADNELAARRLGTGDWKSLTPDSTKVRAVLRVHPNVAA